MLDEAIAGSAGFDFACECSSLLENGALASENCMQSHFCSELEGRMVKE